MRKKNFSYICQNMANLSGFPIHYYIGNELVEFDTLVPFCIDPINLYIDELLKVEKTISFFITPYFMYYGIVCHKNHRIIIGPVCYARPERSTLREIVFLLGGDDTDVASFRLSMQSIPIMALQNFLHMLAMVNYYVNDEMKSLQDIIIYDSLNSIPYQQIVQESADLQSISSYQLTEFPEVHNTLQFENVMLEYVENGDIKSLTNFVNHIAPGNIGKTAETYFRQLRNTFIITVTLVSRAAIRGGLSTEEALTLSDNYIQKVEILQDTDRILNLHANMVFDYTDRVAKQNMNGHTSKFVKDVMNYVHSHITEIIRVEQMAEDFFMCRSNLTTRFRKESGQTLSLYIQSEKIKESKRLLAQTNRTILDISNYLGFSSQSHFQNSFKRITGMTPKQFREKGLKK